MCRFSREIEQGSGAQAKPASDSRLAVVGCTMLW